MDDFTFSDTIADPDSPALLLPSPSINIPSSAPTITSGVKILQIPEINDMIVHLLAGRDLAEFMRVNSYCFVDAVGAVRDSQVATVSHSSQAAAYSAAVHTIDAQISPTAHRAYSSSPDIGSAWLPKPTRYHERVIDFFIRPLLDQFPKLRKVYFGCSCDSFLPAADKYTSFVVTLDAKDDDLWLVGASSPAPSSGVAPASVTASGHIEIGHPCRISLSAPPPANFSGYYAYHTPPPNFTISNHYNLILHSDIYPRDYSNNWLHVIRGGNYLKDLHHHVDFSTLAIELDDLSNIYTAQKAAGRRGKDRLQTIKAASILPFDISNFTSFANIASTSLVTLDLGSDYFYQKHNVYASDLAALVSTIRENLTSLEQLTMAVHGMEEAEVMCWDALTERSLEAGGRIMKLRIHGQEPGYLIFNIIRVVSGMCALGAAVHISSVYYTEAAQSEYLRYLRRQCIARQKHLAVADFRSLLFLSLNDISELEYDHDDKPLPRGSRHRKAWSDKGSTLQTHMLDTLIPNIQRDMAAFEDGARILHSMPSTATSRERHEATSAVVQAGEAARMAVSMLKNVAKDYEDMVSEGRRSLYQLERIW